MLFFCRLLLIHLLPGHSEHHREQWRVRSHQGLTDADAEMKMVNLRGAFEKLDFVSLILLLVLVT